MQHLQYLCTVIVSPNLTIRTSLKVLVRREALARIGLPESMSWSIVVVKKVEGSLTTSVGGQVYVT